MQGLTYNVDLIMCIDCTGSMSGILSTVKSNALKFYSDLQKALERKGKIINKLRVKVIAYRDFYVDEGSSLNETGFFVLPDQEVEFSAFVNTLSPSGGGDEPESGMEALALGIQSDWNKKGDRRREIMIVWTDASAHKLEKADTSSNEYYPSGMPSNFDELTDMWEGQGFVNNSAKRMLLFAPDAYPWTDIATYWENVIHYPSKAGDGLSELDYSTIQNTIVASI